MSELIDVSGLLTVPQHLHNHGTQHALLTDSVMASREDLEALLKMLKTKLAEAKTVGWVDDGLGPA